MRKVRAKRIIHRTVEQYPIVVQEDVSGGFWVSCPTFEGCYSQGETIEEALENIRESIALCREELRDRVPEKTANVSLHFVRV
jgi:predicted RNase H-like HicB family nuclease